MKKQSKPTTSSGVLGISGFCASSARKCNMSEPFVECGYRR
jgi:hypothetical protein